MRVSSSSLFWTHCRICWIILGGDIRSRRKVQKRSITIPKANIEAPMIGHIIQPPAFIISNTRKVPLENQTASYWILRGKSSAFRRRNMAPVTLVGVTLQYRFFKAKRVVELELYRPALS